MSHTPDTDQAYCTTLKTLSELKSYVGKELGISEWITVTQERINVFSEVTEDHQWIHTDPEMSAKHSPYKKTIAQGFFVLSMASKFCYETYQVEEIGMGVNYGLDRVRFTNATTVDSLLRGRVSLKSCDDLKGGGGVKLKVNIVFELKGQEKPACVAEFIALCYAK